MRASYKKRLQMISIVAASTVPTLLIAATSTWTYAPGGGNWIASWNDVTTVKPWSPNSPFPNNSSAAVVFPAVYGAGPTPVITAGSGTVVLSGLGVSVGQMTFFGGGANVLADPSAVGGFNITGTGSITVVPNSGTNAATIEVGSSGRVGITTIPGIATISTSLINTAGVLYKTGIGTLVLTASNSLAGQQLAISGGTVRVTSTNTLSGLATVSTLNNGQFELRNASSSGTIFFGGGSSTIRPEGVFYNSAGDNSWNGFWMLLVSGQTLGVETGSRLTLNGDLLDATAPSSVGLIKVGGGTLAIGSVTLTSPLSIKGGIYQTKLNSTVSDIRGLTIAGGASPTAKWDMTNNSVVIRNDNQAAITGYLAAGYADGAWSGNGVASSRAQADAIANGGEAVTGIGMARGDQLPDWNGSSSHFGSLTLAASDIAMMYTFSGDTNLDGTVDLNSDFAHFLTGLTGASASLVSGGGDWFHGDMNFDGNVDIDHDFPLFVAGYDEAGSSLNALRAAISNASTLSPTQKLTMIEIVPEPGGISATVFAVIGLIGRRRSTKR